MTSLYDFRWQQTVGNMKDYERILAVVDPHADTQPALNRAAALARTADAHLDLLICTYDDHLAGTRFGDSRHLQESRKSVVQAALEQLETMAAPLRAGGLDIDVHSEFVHPLHEGIIAKAGELGSDVIVKDTRYHHLLERTVFSNTDWELIRLCPIDLMLIKLTEWAAEPVILAAVDPMHIGDKPAVLDHQILMQGLALSKMLAGRLQVVHCYPVIVPTATTGTGMVLPAPADAESLRASLEATHRQALDEFIKGYSIDNESVLLVPGEPRRKLVELAATQNADLMVVGAVSRSRIKRVFLGFTALSILDRLPCDLLIVRPGSNLT